MENCLSSFCNIITLKALDIHISAKVYSSKIKLQETRKKLCHFLKIYFHGQLDDNSQPVSMWHVAQLF